MRVRINEKRACPCYFRLTEAGLASRITDTFKLWDDASQTMVVYIKTGIELVLMFCEEDLTEGAVGVFTESGFLTFKDLGQVVQWTVNRYGDSVEVWANVGLRYLDVRLI